MVGVQALHRFGRQMRDQAQRGRVQRARQQQARPVGQPGIAAFGPDPQLGAAAPVEQVQHRAVVGIAQRRVEFGEQLRAELGLVRQAHPVVGVNELVDDESLDKLSCVVVSEVGEVRAGVAQQIEAIRIALSGAEYGAEHNE